MKRLFIQRLADSSQAHYCDDAIDPSGNNWFRFIVKRKRFSPRPIRFDEGISSKSTGFLKQVLVYRTKLRSLFGPKHALAQSNVDLSIRITDPLIHRVVNMDWSGQVSCCCNQHSFLLEYLG